MNYIYQKQHQTEVLRKPPQAKNKIESNTKTKYQARDMIEQSLREQLKKRQHVIQRMYKKSVANKLYIFPRAKQDIDNVSLSSNESIEQMNQIETYKLGSQNHQSNATIKNNVNYFSQSIVSTNNEDSKTKIDLRKFRTKYSSNKKLLDSQSVQKIVYSSRVNPKLLFKGSLSKKKDEQISSLNKETKGKSYSSIYQQILNKVGIKIEREPRQKSNSTSSAMKKAQFTYRRNKAQNSSQESVKNRYKFNKQPNHQISVSKILQKYKSSSKKKEQRCKTQY